MRFVALVGVSLALGCGNPPPEPTPAANSQALPAGAPTVPVRKDGTVFGETELMGTRVSINVFVGSEKNGSQAGAAIEAAFGEIDRLENIMSEWRPDSELSRLAARAKDAPMTTSVAVSPELYDVLQRAHKISQDTDGAFDVTFHGVGQLWSFTPGAVPPSREKVADHLPLVNWRGVSMEPNSTIKLTTAGMKVGLGAIGKGYAVDAASKILATQGFPNHIVEAGGDTYVSGTKGPKPWVVGVQAPGRRGTVGALPIRDRAVVTSGDYQRFIEHEGKRYAHILDPRTGWPIEREDAAKSVTLVANDATAADAYCTAVVVMGLKRGMEFVESRPELEAVMIDQDGEIQISKGLADLYIATPAPAP